MSILDEVARLQVAELVAKMELEHHARGEVIKALRQEREDYRAASLSIRRQLAPLLGCGVDNEPADSMVGRMVGYFEVAESNARLAEQRGHDKGVEACAKYAQDDYQLTFAKELLALRLGTPEQASKPRCIREDGVELRRTASGFVDDQPTKGEEVARATGAEWQGNVPLVFGPPGMASVAPSPGYYRVYDSDQGCGLYVKVTADGVVWGYSEHEGVPGYRTLGKQWVTFAAEPGNERLRWEPDHDRVAMGCRVGGAPPEAKIGMVATMSSGRFMVTSLPWTWMADTTSITAPFSDVVVWRRG